MVEAFESFMIEGAYFGTIVSWACAEAPQAARVTINAGKARMLPPFDDFANRWGFVVIWLLNRLPRRDRENEAYRPPSVGSRLPAIRIA